MMSRCSTWQNASLKEPSEIAEYPWRKSIPKEELTTESVPVPVGPIGLWQSVVVTSYDMMMIEFTSVNASWTVIQRSKHSSVSRMFVREKPQSVRFMIIVTDPLNAPNRWIIKVSREVTEAIPLICASQAPLEMVLVKPLKPRPKTNGDRAKVDKVDKPNAEIADSKDDKGDIAKGAGSQIDEVAKIERDKASEAKTDAVAENKNGGVPQERDSKANVGQSTEAPQQQQQQSQQLCCDTDGAPACDSAQRVQQRTVEQVIDVPTESETAETEPATFTLDRELLDVTQRVIRAKAAPRTLAECSLSRAVRREFERVRYEQEAQRRCKRARAR